MSLYDDYRRKICKIYRLQVSKKSHLGIPNRDFDHVLAFKVSTF